MKQSGLKNRFPDEVRNLWLDWHECMVCGYNQPDVLHHIISPSSPFYKAGKHNESALNSCPIHNYAHPNCYEMVKQGLMGFGVTQPCHVGNEAWLHDGKNASMLLRKVYEVLRFDLEYQLKPIDEQFIETYSKVYSMI